MFTNSPYRLWLILAGVVFVPKSACHDLNQKDKHLGITPRGHAGKVEKNDKDHDGPYKAAEQDLKARARKQGGGKQSPFHPHNGQWLVERLVNRIGASRDLCHVAHPACWM
jgi:hypothetical protein